jgi:RNA polymerase sigma-70 factor (ECF subfamily)
VELRADHQHSVFTGSGLKRDRFDHDYLQRLKEGDYETEQQFADYFGKLLLIKLRRRMIASQVVEDVRQETFVRVLAALKSKKGLPSPESLGAFVNSECNNVLLEMHRRPLQRGTVEIQARPGAPLKEQFDPPDRGASVEPGMVTEERVERTRQILAQILEELPPRDRELLRMVFHEDADKDQVCRSLRVERGYLRLLLHRANARFREIVKRHEDGIQADA